MKKFKVDYHTEFELDLAPLLAVMVKLVPVLLVSSAFVQMMIIETELPQVVQQAIEKQQRDPKKNISLEVSQTKGLKLVLDIEGKIKAKEIPLAHGQFDYSSLYQELTDVKKQYPEIFQLDLIPDNDVAYKDLVKIMDEVRKTKDQNLKFPVKDEKTGKTSETNYMFPEVVFVNMTEG